MSTPVPHPTPSPGTSALGPGEDTSAPVRGGWVRRVLSTSGFRYLAVGASAFVVDVALLALLHEVLHLPVWLSAGLGFVCSFLYTYLMQRLAFRSEVPHQGALVRYVVLVAANTVVVALIVQGMSQTAAGWVGGKVVATALTTVWNYFAYRYWVFPQRERPLADEDREDS